MRAQEIVVGDSSSRPTDDAERCCDLVPPPNPPLTAPATTSATITHDIPTTTGTTVEKGEARPEGPYDNTV